MKVNKLFKLLIVFVGLFSFITVYADGTLDSPLDSNIINNNNSNLDNSNNTGNVVYHNETTGFDSIIIDDENLLSDDQERMLADDMQPLTEHGGIAFVSASCSYSSDSCARDYYRQLFNYNSGTVFLIDMNNRNIYIFSDGSNYSVITKSKAEIITDNTYRYATNGDYYSCASKAFEQMKTLFAGGKIAEPMRYIVNGLLSLFLGFLLCFLVAAFSFNSKKNTRTLQSNYVKSLAIANFAAVVTGQHTVYNPPSSSGGGSGGGGGGGSSGGGGGHGF